MITTESLVNIHHYTDVDIFFLWRKLLRSPFLSTFKHEVQYYYLQSLRRTARPPDACVFITRSWHFLAPFTHPLLLPLAPPICSLNVWVLFFLWRIAVASLPRFTSYLHFNPLDSSNPLSLTPLTHTHTHFCLNLVLPRGFQCTFHTDLCWLPPPPHPHLHP